jgi:hypothetical protein
MQRFVRFSANGAAPCQAASSGVDNARYDYPPVDSPEGHVQRR